MVVAVLVPALVVLANSQANAKPWSFQVVVLVMADHDSSDVHTKFSTDGNRRELMTELLKKV